MVNFYDASSATPADSRQVALVFERLGVDDAGNANGWHDSQGRFADIALLRLTADVPSFARTAAIPRWRIGENVHVVAVGVRAHDGRSDMIGRVRCRVNSVGYWDTGDHTVNTNDHAIDSGDSGGPLYSRAEPPIVHGILWGYYWDIWGVQYRNRYTTRNPKSQSDKTWASPRAREPKRIRRSGRGLPDFKKLVIRASTGDRGPAGDCSTLVKIPVRSAEHRTTDRKTRRSTCGEARGVLLDLARDAARAREHEEVGVRGYGSGPALY